MTISKAQNDEHEQFPQKIYPFHKSSIATRIQRLSVAHRNGDDSEVKQILNALKNRGQKIVRGFESFVASRSDLDILKALEPLLLVIDPKDIGSMERTLLKYSKFNLTYELIVKAHRIHELESNVAGMRFSNFLDLFNLQPLEQFYFSLEFFQKKEIELRRPEDIFVFEKVLRMSDHEVIELINNLNTRGIPVKIRKADAEIDTQSPPSEAYRLITPSDYARPDWYGYTNQTPWLNLYRKAVRTINGSNPENAIEELKELLNFNNNFSKVVNLLIEGVNNKKIAIDQANSLILDHCKTKDYVSIEPFVAWYETVAEIGDSIALTALQEFAVSLHPERQRSRLLLDIVNVDNLLENREWQTLRECIRFLGVLTQIQTTSQPSNSAVGYFFLNCKFFRDQASVFALEKFLGREITAKEFSLGVSSYETDFDEDDFFSWLEYGNKLNYIDQRIIEKIYKVGLIQLSPKVLKYAIEDGQLPSSIRTPIRQEILRYELSSGSFENGKDLFDLTSSIGDIDQFDSVLLVQSCSFEHIPRVEEILTKFASEGGIIDVRTIGVLCNRYARNNRYEDVLRVLEYFDQTNYEDITILELYRLAALSNLGKESEAFVVLNSLLKNRNQYLIQKYAPSILRKIENVKVSSLASALDFELNEMERPVVIRKVVENSTGIARNRNLPLEVKKIYASLCQVCKLALETPFGLLSEAAHIQGLGHPHYGSDDITNLLCLCPNHHKLFDNAGWYISDEFEVIETLTGRVLTELLVSDKHEISLSAVSYQRNYALNAASKGQRSWN